jgi:TRAP-type mannitol/chloroaromatic compound transport system substrate-binding protein
LLRAFLAISKDVVSEAGSGNPLSRKIYASYEKFRKSAMNWSDCRQE